MMLVLFEQMAVDLVRTTVDAWDFLAQYFNSSIPYPFLLSQGQKNGEGFLVV